MKHFFSSESLRTHKQWNCLFRSAFICACSSFCTTIAYCCLVFPPPPQAPAIYMLHKHFYAFISQLHSKPTDHAPGGLPTVNARRLCNAEACRAGTIIGAAQQRRPLQRAPPNGAKWCSRRSGGGCRRCFPVLYFSITTPRSNEPSA